MHCSWLTSSTQCQLRTKYINRYHESEMCLIRAKWQMRKWSLKAKYFRNPVNEASTCIWISLHHIFWLNRQCLDNPFQHGCFGYIYTVNYTLAPFLNIHRNLTNTHYPLHARNCLTSISILKMQLVIISHTGLDMYSAMMPSIHVAARIPERSKLLPPPPFSRSYQILFLK